MTLAKHSRKFSSASFAFGLPVSFPHSSWYRNPAAIRSKVVHSMCAPLEFGFFKSTRGRSIFLHCYTTPGPNGGRTVVL